MPDPGAGRDIAELMADFRSERAYPHDDAALRRACAEGMDLSQRHYKARSFIGLPQAAFAARAYAACFGQLPEPAVFAQMRVRLLDGAVTQTSLLRELAIRGGAKAGHSHFRVCAVRPWRDGIARSFTGDIALQAARLARDLVRLPRNLGRKLAQKTAAAGSGYYAAPQIAAPGKPRIAILAVAGKARWAAPSVFMRACWTV